MRKLIATIVLLMILIVPAALADTGTYEISQEHVSLIPNTDRTTTLEYTVTFLVTGGNIPWVTLGTPNSDYDVLSFSGSATSADKHDSGGWSGVYIALDKDYKSGESFTFETKILQRGMLHNVENNKTSLSFTPVWWDNAVTRDLQVTIQPPPGVGEVTTTTQATSMQDGKVVWSWTNVGRGEKHNVGVLMASESFANETSTTSGGSGLNIPGGSIIWVPIVIIGIIAILAGIGSSSGRSYSSPRVSFEKDDDDEPEVTRHISMDCPNGDHGRLDKRDVNGTTIDFCLTCGGAYFDKGEVEALIKKGTEEKEFNTADTKYVSDFKEGYLKCPRCDSPLTKKTRKTGNGEEEATIFACGACLGIWMNRGNFQKVKTARLDQEAKAKEKKDNSKDDDDYTPYPVAWWLFGPHIGSTGNASSPSFGGGSFGGGGASTRSSSSSYASSCVSCACVASACACACACAGGGGASCSPKDRIESRGIKMEELYPERMR